VWAPFFTPPPPPPKEKLNNYNNNNKITHQGKHDKPISLVKICYRNENNFEKMFALLILLYLSLVKRVLFSNLIEHFHVVITIYIYRGIPTRESIACCSYRYWQNVAIRIEALKFGDERSIIVSSFIVHENDMSSSSRRFDGGEK